MANNDGNAPSDGAKREGPLRRAYNYIRHPRTSRSRRRRTPANITQPPAGPSTAQNVPPAGSSAAPQNDAPNDGQNNAQDDQAGDQHDQQYFRGRYAQENV
ncbi:hypothetical protein ATEIFO6365_0001030100 [Aspergillus terreus]|uniref:Uncharacterized protein n=1 Tax=Aspergillus terreus TaxID=33178 RepID=A0A5M3YP41_ASPTE|nr:hypothetical protein ATETN484_0001022200 [Aspergillus terreus]GFF12078.1 hypothetical protein ATEIFO6365_0001030100 [Aspergillus terreus]